MCREQGQARVAGFQTALDVCGVLGVGERRKGGCSLENVVVLPAAARCVLLLCVCVLCVMCAWCVNYK